MAIIDEIREKVKNREYYLSQHAEDEMANDKLERKDAENVINTGFVEKKYTHDVRGTRYRIEGKAKDGRIAHVICRIKEEGILIIITAYEKGAKNEM